MKILHIVSSYWPAFKMGGPIRSVHLLNKSLIEKGVDVSVFTTNAGLENEKNRELGMKETIDGVRVFRFPYYGYINYSFSPALFWKLKREIKNFDVVHIAEIWNFPVFAAVFWARVYGKPYVFSPRGSLMIEPLKKSRIKKKIFLFLAVKNFLKNAAMIHFTAEAEKEEYLKAGLPLMNFVIIPNSIDFKNLEKDAEESKDIDFKKDFGISPDKKTILFLSRIDWKKGLDTLIPAFAGAAKQYHNLVLILAGADSLNYKKTVESLIKVNGVEDRVIFTGLLEGAARAAAFKSADMFVLSSLAENFGMAVAEAMYFGLPVIITKYVGISPEIAKNSAGIVIEKKEKDLAEAILKILNNPDMAKKMGEQGRELVKKEFSPPIVADKILKLYNEINGRKFL